MISQQWEYLFVKISKQEVVEVNGRQVSDKDRMAVPLFAHQRGEQGWELVTALGDFTPAYMIFKRPKN